MTEEDPTAIDPDEPEEEGLPPKPAIENMPPEEGIDASDVEEEEVPEDDFMDEDEAEDDDTVDNNEEAEAPLTRDQLPEGSHRDDYDNPVDPLKERQDSEEETPPRR